MISRKSSIGLSSMTQPLPPSPALLTRMSTTPTAIHESRDGVAVVDVERAHLDIESVGFRDVREIARRRIAHRGNDVMAVARQAQRRGVPDSGAASGDDCNAHGPSLSRADHNNGQTVDRVPPHVPARCRGTCRDRGSRDRRRQQHRPVVDQRCDGDQLGEGPAGARRTSVPSLDAGPGLAQLEAAQGGRPQGQSRRLRLLDLQLRQLRPHAALHRGVARALREGRPRHRRRALARVRLREDPSQRRRRR